MYHTLMVMLRCYHRDHSVTKVWCTIVSLVWIPFALTLWVCKMRCVRIAKNLLVQKADTMACIIQTTFALTLYVQKGNALTVLMQKADAVAYIIHMTFALTLCVWKKFALTFCISKICATFRRQMP